MTDSPSKATQRRRVRAWYADLLSEIPQGWTPLEAVAAVKALTDDGDVVLLTHKTESLNVWEALGMLISAADDMRSALQTSKVEDD